MAAVLRMLRLHVQGGDLIRDLLNLEVVATLNTAFCNLHHRRQCISHPRLQRECDKVGHNSCNPLLFCMYAQIAVPANLLSTPKHLQDILCWKTMWDQTGISSTRSALPSCIAREDEFARDACAGRGRGLL